MATNTISLKKKIETLKKGLNNLSKSSSSTDNIISDYQLRFEQIKKEN
jgi:hypothetical protein